MTGCCYEANDPSRSGAGDETIGRNVTGGGEADHLVSSGGDTGDQLPANAALALLHSLFMGAGSLMN
jgi:hypothetical protein